ncbi:uncharacterized protein LOC133832192 [Humulus lupulus]|uniref:uncharacterized protein LOC133832192 n=1 Tax=Humulus lupulus TaxID=3486 RepID=UPI002B417A65|nr:uncharacterized protein LOC133832192 [Humulus lupulus]
MAEQSPESRPLPNTDARQNTEHPTSNIVHSEKEPQVWKLDIDGSSIDQLFGAGQTLITPEGQLIHCELCFGFKASNNEAEYDALIAGLGLAREVKAEVMDIYSDSQLVVNQILGEYIARGEKMMARTSPFNRQLSILDDPDSSLSRTHSHTQQLQ